MDTWRSLNRCPVSCWPARRGLGKLGSSREKLTGIEELF